MDRAAPRLLVVTDRSVLPHAALREAFDRLLDRVPPGSVGVYLRDPGAPDGETLAEAERWVALCSKAGRSAPVLVRGRADIALAAGAAGVHLQASGIPPADVRALAPRLLVGYSAHAPDEVVRVAPGVDYLTFSPVFASPGKGPPLGLPALGAACRAARATPVLALGGIVEPAQVRSAVAAGVRGVAVIRGVLSAADPVDAALRLLAAADPARSLSGKSRRRVRGSRGRIPVR